MKRIYKGNDLVFNLSVNNIPINMSLIKTIEFKFYTLNSANYIKKTEASVDKDNQIILQWQELEKLEQGVLYYDYKMSLFDDTMIDTTLDSVEKVMTDYYIVTGKDSMDISYESAKWGKIEGDINLLLDLKEILDSKADKTYVDTELTKKLNESDAVGKKYINEGGSEGGEIFNDYTNNKATNNYSHAEGEGTTAFGPNSHAEGEGTTAFGLCSHAEGFSTTASGNYSHTEGFSTTASGNYSHTEGRNSEAEGDCSHTEGRNSEAEGDCSHTEGYQTVALGEKTHIEGHSSNKATDLKYGPNSDKELKDATEEEIIDKWQTDNFSLAKGVGSHAEGYNCLALSSDSHAEGLYTTASGDGSHAEGLYTTASGGCSHAEGSITEASGGGSHAEGSDTKASGDGSHVEGLFTIAENMCQHSQGLFNTKEAEGQASPYDYDATKILFSIGNGWFDARSDALKMLGNGETWIAGAVHNPQADYAEMFEWQDKNPSNEDRVGYFVAMKDDKIVKATSKDSYILGIVSAAPAIIGDNPNLWHGQYINDEWGRPIYEDVEVKYTTYETNEQGERVEVEKTRTDHIRKINPEWKSEEPYIDRTKRKEWDAIGLMGKLLVRQDGTLTAGSFCKPNDQGIATKSDTGYYVMKVNNENQALVLFK